MAGQARHELLDSLSAVPLIAGNRTTSAVRPERGKFSIHRDYGGSL